MKRTATLLMMLVLFGTGVAPTQALAAGATTIPRARHGSAAVTVDARLVAAPVPRASTSHSRSFRRSSRSRGRVSWGGIIFAFLVVSVATVVRFLFGHRERSPRRKNQ